MNRHTMVVNNAGIELIKKFESLHDGDLKTIGLQPKMDPLSIWTVGYGHALADPVTRKFLKGTADKKKAYDMYPNMSEAEAIQLLQRDLEIFSKAVKPLIKSKINDNQFSAIVSFAYNCGVGNLQKSTLLKKVNLNPLDPTIKDSFAVWNKGGGKVLPGLVKRRAAEADLYFS